MLVDAVERRLAQLFRMSLAFTKDLAKYRVDNIPIAKMSGLIGLLDLLLSVLLALKANLSKFSELDLDDISKRIALCETSLLSVSFEYQEFATIPAVPRLSKIEWHFGRIRMLLAYFMHRACRLAKSCGFSIQSSTIQGLTYSIPLRNPDIFLRALWVRFFNGHVHIVAVGLC